MVKKYDDAELLRVFDETNNGRETARRLGIHPATAQVALRRLRGLCPRCRKPKAANRRECPECVKQSAARMKERRKDRRRLGLCSECDQPNTGQSKFCERHRIENIDYRRQREATKKAIRLRGCSAGGQSTEWYRLRAIRENYGEDGLRAWHEAQARCAICDRHYSEVSVQLHHIDQNRKNNTVENFACLCFDCHQSVHRLLDAPSMTKLLAWFGKTYPDKMK